MAADPGDGGVVSESRVSERRRYNRRQSDTQPAPPYFETFDRIATALENIEHALVLLTRRLGEESAPAPGARDDGD
jgi:hypothetical protein